MALIPSFILRLFDQASIKSDQLEKALELTSLLNLQRSLQGALKLANVMRKTVLSEKITSLIQNREAFAEKANVQSAIPLSVPFSQNTVQGDNDAGHLSNQHQNPFSRGHKENAMDAGKKRGAETGSLSPKAAKNPFARRN